MKKIGMIAACVFALGMVAAVPALAQNQEEQEFVRNWTFRAGFFVPERGAARAAQGDIWLTLGAEHGFFMTDRWQGSVSVDYYGSGSIYNVPVMFNVRGETHRFRYGVGAGVGFGHDLNGGSTNFAYNLLVGYNLRPGTHPIVGDIRYMGTGSSAGQLNGWAFSVGYQY